VFDITDGHVKLVINMLAEAGGDGKVPNVMGFSHTFKGNRI
jgi:hypothetical protein